MRILGLSAALLILGGCASTNEPPVQANDPSFAPVVPDYPRYILTLPQEESVTSSL